MRIEEQREDVMVGGAESVNAFTIKASAKAFQVLSQNLYSNPLGSVIRELSTNAYDAHVDSGKKDVPFILTLPNSLEPTFKVRDFGTGLTEDEISHVYTTFFESTKTDSNDVVGCLGLGSKSPFGVADSFTISSYQNGKKTIYSAFLDDARIPSIAKFGVFDTEEDNGLEIEVAIKEDDFRVFTREVNTQLKYFRVKPTILGNADFEWDVEEEYLYEGTNWKMVKNGNTIRVLQGQIQYPVSVDDMGKHYDNADAIIQAILNSPILFEVNIGDVNIAPSREALSYDDRTSKNIVDAAKRIAEELPNMINIAIQKCETEYEAKLKCYEIINQLGYSRYSYRTKSLSNLIDSTNKIMWNGKKVSSLEISIPKEKVEHATNFSTTYTGRFQKSRYGAYARKQEDGTEAHFVEMKATPLKRTMWVYSTENDKAVEARAKQYFKNNYNWQGSGANLIIIKVPVTVTPADLANELGLRENQLVIASTLDKVKRKNYGKKKKKGEDLDVPLFQKSEMYSHRTKTDFWPTVNVKKATDMTGYYVDLDRYDALDQSGCKISNFDNFVKGAIELGFITDKDHVYGLRKSMKKQDHNLVNLFDYITANKDSITLKPKYELGNGSAVSKMRSNISTVKKIHKLIGDDSPMKKITEALIANHDTQYSNDARKVIEKMGLYAKTVDVSNDCEMLDTLYPMIAELNYYFNSTPISDYVNQMDRLRLFEKMAVEKDHNS